jgi:hypothetical protein
MFPDDNPDALSACGGPKTMHARQNKANHRIDRVVPTWTAKSIYPTIQVGAIATYASNLIVSH